MNYEAARELREREKELECIYGLIRLIETPGITFEGICEGLVDLVPPAWQHPEVTRARLTFDGRVYTAGERGGAVAKQSADVLVHGEKRGALVVGYTRRMPEADEGPFLKEERRLVDALAERLGRAAERLEAEGKLIKERERWERSFASVGEGIYLVDRDFNVIQCNEAFARMLGKSKEEIIGRKCHEIVHGLDRTPESCVTCRAVREQQSARCEMYEPWLKRHIAVAADPSYDAEGNFEFVVHLIRDVSERKRYEAELELVNRELDGYARTVSHDLKGPLSNVAMACELAGSLLEETPGRETMDDFRELLDTGKSSIRRALNLVDDLLVLASTGQQPENPRPVSVSETVREVLRDKDAEISARNISFEIDPDLGRVVADPTHIYQVFSNLVGNAVRYVDGDRPVVRIAYHGDGGEHRYVVRDDGSGIPEDIAETLFRPFIKGRDRSGTGIGLSIVQKIVETYGGQIRAYNDGGAVFEFTLRDCGGDGAPRPDRPVLSE